MQLVLQRLRNLHSDGALCVSHAIRERHLVNGVAREFRAQQDEADLRPVAVGHNDAVALFDDRHDVVRRLACRTVLIQHVHVLRIPDQRITANRDDDEGIVSPGLVFRHLRYSFTLSAP